MKSLISKKVLALRDVLGELNHGSSYLENTKFIREVVAQCLESVLVYDNDNVLPWVHGEAEKHREIMLFVTGQGKVEFEINREKYKGYVSFCSATQNIPKEKAVRFLIEMLGYVQLARLLDVNLNKKTSSGYTYFGRNPKVIGPEVIDLRGRYFYKSNEILFSNFSGGVDFCVVPYINGDEYFLLPFTLYKKPARTGAQGFLAPGLPSSKHLLLNANSLNSKKNGKVLFFENLKMASEIQSRIDDAKSIPKDVYIITAHYGGINAIDNVDMSCIAEHDVYIIPSPSKDGYFNAIMYAKKFMELGANKVMVVLDPTLEHPKREIDDDYAELSSPIERFIAQNAICYKERDIAPMIDRIVKFAIPYERFVSWAQDMMIINVTSSVSSDDSFSSLVSNGFDMVRAPLKEIDDTVISLHVFLRPDKVTMCAGFSHEGKTIFNMSLVLSYISGIDMFIFKNNKPGNVLLVDSESGEDFIQEILVQLSKAYGVEESVLAAFHYISLLDMPRDNDNRFDLLSEITQIWLQDYVEKNYISLIVLDNLQSMFENASSSSKVLHLLTKFVELMQSINVAVLLIHHTLDSKKDKPQGLTQLINRMRNWILLEGPATLGPELVKLDEDGDPFVAKFIHEPGVLVRVVFKKSNSYPRLRGKKFLYHLPFANVRTQESKKWISADDDYYASDECNFSDFDGSKHLGCVDSESFNDGVIDIIPTDDKVADIKPVDVFQVRCDIVIKYAQNHPDFNGAQLQRVFSWTKKPVKKILDHLVESGVLDRTGSTSTRMYRLRLDYDKN